MKDAILRAVRENEEGNIAIETVIGLFSLALALCAVVEFGSWSLAYMAVDDAAYATSRALAQDTALSDSELAQIAVKTSPTLANGTVSVAKDVSAPRSVAYTHHLPNGEGDRASYAVSRKVATDVIYEFKTSSILGRMVAGGETMTVKSRSVLNADALVEGGSSPW